MHLTPCGVSKPAVLLISVYADRILESLVHANKAYIHFNVGYVRVYTRTTIKAMKPVVWSCRTYLTL